MVSFIWGLALLGGVSQTLAAPSYQAQPERAAAVQEAFDRAWTGYYTYAFPNDGLLPISHSYVNDLGGWGASAIDAFSTALIMGDQKVIGQILDYVPKIDFDVANYTSSISLFETTIRYLGGLLSAHDLLSGPLSNLVQDNSSVSAILDQAVHLADLLSVAFNTPTGIPINDLDWEPPRATNETSNGLATIGTLVLEWTRLSDKTGDTKYAELSQKGESYLLNPQPKAVAEPFPGLLGTNVDVRNGSFLDSSGGWGGGDDSFYEYLIKMYLYDTDRFGAYKDRWIAAIDSSIEYIASHPTTRPDLTFLGGWDGTDVSFESEHLACFDGGNIILGGLTLDRQDYIDFGLELVNGCHDTYNETATGIGPEVFAWQDSNLSPNATNNPAPPADQLAFYQKSGFWIPDGYEYYDLRPEVIESYYYAYRATGDTKYQDWAWDAFLNINASCSVGAGFGGIENVNVPGGDGWFDHQESFWFAEVLKYSYLIQAEEALWQVSASHDNQWVFNTEAHPVKVAGQPI
ncbi:glycoside hydrolase family 47 protein [Xylariales sp. AK1849]|nr:glycoside hydrolase family 47 protein [Xylariales sp. AK1849]